MSTLLRTENLYRRFKSGSETVEALKNVNITIEKGALTILRGRSGSGKTTLINLLGGMDDPTEGKIYFDGQDISALPQRKKDAIRKTSMGIVFQSGALISNLTAYENIDLELRICGVSPKERKIRIEECLNFVGMLKRKNHFPYEMSGGEAQRVAIARAIAHKPKVVFADEPTSALDTNMGLHVVKAFKDMVEKEGLTVVMTTHDPNMMEVANYVYTLRDGVIIDE